MTLVFSNQLDLQKQKPVAVERVVSYYYGDGLMISYKDSKGKNRTKTIKTGSKFAIYAR